jgi:hypothetical protein
MTYSAPPSHQPLDLRLELHGTTVEAKFLPGSCRG